MRPISSRDNPLFKQLKRLSQCGRERRKTGTTLLDGAHLIRAYEQVLGQVDLLIVEEGQCTQTEIARLLAGRNEVVLMPQALFRELAAVETPTGILARITIPDALPVDSSVDSLILDGVQDPGNAGTLLRTAAAAGFRQVLLSPDCAAAWSPKVLRAGQGAHFLLSIHEEPDLPGFLNRFQGSTAVTHLDATESLFETAWRNPVAWIFGNEGQGVRPSVAAAAQLRVKIPMPGAVESLNVTAAAAICLFETVRRRLSG